MERVLRKGDIARKIAEKYKGIAICDAEVFIDIMLDAIIDSILNERCTVDLHRFGRFGLKLAQINGRDFKTGEQLRKGERFKVVFRPAVYLRNQARLLSPDIPKAISKEE